MSTALTREVLGPGPPGRLAAARAQDGAGRATAMLLQVNRLAGNAAACTVVQRQRSEAPERTTRLTLSAESLAYLRPVLRVPDSADEAEILWGIRRWQAENLGADAHSGVLDERTVHALAWYLVDIGRPGHAFTLITDFYGLTVASRPYLYRIDETCPDYNGETVCAPDGSATVTICRHMLAGLSSRAVYNLLVHLLAHELAHVRACGQHLPPRLSEFLAHHTAIVGDYRLPRLTPGPLIEAVKMAMRHYHGIPIDRRTTDLENMALQIQFVGDFAGIGETLADWAGDGRRRGRLKAARALLADYERLPVQYRNPLLQAMRTALLRLVRSHGAGRCWIDL